MSLCNLLSRIYIWYRYFIYGYLEEVRGATRLANFLRDQAMKRLPQIQEGTSNIQDFEWDYLVILDACRYDKFQEVTGKDCDYRITSGSSTREFIESNFRTGDFEDTVYIATIPWFNDDYFPNLTGGKKLEEVFNTVYQLFNTDWDEENSTVLPEDVFENAVSADKLFPDNRMIIHFLQPHGPFLNKPIRGMDPELEKSADIMGVDEAVYRGRMTHQDYVEGYEYNLEQVWKQVEMLLDELEGRVMITADHGELLGENRLYGHPPKSDAVALRKVPKAEFDI